MRVLDTPPRRVNRDKKASKESSGYANRDLDGEALQNDHDRIESLRSHVHMVEKVLLWACSLLLILGLGAWSWHLLTPTKWAFLDADQLSTIQHLLTTVAVSGLVGNVARRVMKAPTPRFGDQE